MSVLSPVAALNALVPPLTRGRGTVQLAARSVGGFGSTSPVLQHGTLIAPLHLVELVRDDFEIRAPLVSHENHGGQPADLTALFVLWHPGQIFNAASGWRHAIAPEEQARIRAALARSPIAPSLLVDAAHELAAVWWLDPVLRLDAGLDAARALLVRMAETLEGDLEAARGFDSLTFPIAGSVRNWNRNPTDLIATFEVGRDAYTFEALQGAFKEEKN